MRILAVDHDLAAASSLAAALRSLAHDVRIATRGSEALTEVQWANLILLELDLPDLDGVEVCRNIRRSCETPIIIVTNRGGEMDRVLGLQSGADDYVVKPYSFPELAARIDAVLHRVRGESTQHRVLAHRALRLDSVSREVWINGTPVRLTRKEFDLLHLLVAMPDEVFSRERIMSKVWADDSASSSRSRTIDTHVNALRKKLGHRGWIVTVRGIGFRIGRFEPM